MPQAKSFFTVEGSRRASMTNMDTDANYIVKHAGCIECRLLDANACCIADHRNLFSVGDYTGL